MKSGKTLFVRIDFKNGEDEVSEKVAIDSAAYLKQLSIGGTLSNCWSIWRYDDGDN